MSKRPKRMQQAQLYYSPDVLEAGGKYPVGNTKRLAELSNQKEQIKQKLADLSQSCELMRRYNEVQADIRRTRWLIADLRRGSRKRLRGTDYEKASDLRAGLAKEKSRVDDLVSESKRLRSEIRRTSVDNGLLCQLEKVETKLAAARKPVPRRKKRKNAGSKKKKTQKRSIRTISGGGVNPR